MIIVIIIEFVNFPFKIVDKILITNSIKNWFEHSFNAICQKIISGLFKSVFSDIEFKKVFHTFNGVFNIWGRF